VRSFTSFAFAALVFTSASCSLNPPKDKWANFDYVEPPSGSVVAVRDTIALYFDDTPEINIVTANNVRQHFVRGQLTQIDNIVLWSVATTFQGTQVELHFEWIASPYRTVTLTYVVQ
jgi:hypothetical protein